MIQRVSVPVLKVLLAIVFLGVLLFQGVVLPSIAADYAQWASEYGYLQYPLLVAAIAIFIPVQVIIVQVWRLLNLVRADAVFSESTFRQVDIMIWAAGSAAVLAAVLLIILLGVVGPGEFMALTSAIVIATGVALLVYVLKLLLRKAVTLNNSNQVLSETNQILAAELSDVI